MKQTKIMIGDGLWHMPMKAFKNDNSNDKYVPVEVYTKYITELTDYIMGIKNEKH